MRRSIVPMLAALGVAAALFVLLSRPQAATETQGPSEPQVFATQLPLLNESQAVARAVDAIRQAGLQDTLGVGTARQISLIDAVRLIVGDARLDRARQDARLGQVGREEAKPVWLVEIPTNNTAYPTLLLLVDARSGEVHDWPRLPTRPVAVPPLPPTPVYDPSATSQLPAAPNTRGYEVALSGPATKGSTIFIAGRKVQLPPDAYVESWIVSGFCEGPCPELPLYVLKRGNSKISVSARSGTLGEEKVAPGEADAFDFLKEALR